MKRTIKVYQTPVELAEGFAADMVHMIIAKTGDSNSFTIALSGGSTPELLFSVLGDNFGKSVDWQKVHLFWGDERCVKPDSPESNYGMTQRSLLQKIAIPESNIHRIKGENDPSAEAERYSQEVKSFTSERDGLPMFDLIILGLGEDGHTASIFPSSIDLMLSDRICEVAQHPVTQQKRITLTGRVINNAEMAVFMVTGRRKAAIVDKIINKDPSAGNFPASLIVTEHGETVWLLDNEASLLL